MDDHRNLRAILLVDGHISDLLDNFVVTTDHTAEHDVLAWGMYDQEMMARR